jgi:hypothetical protein
MPVRADDQVTVLAIGGWGRCGSTLLDMLLGEVEGFVSAGEVREIWLRGCVENRPCGCGLPFASCPFWSQVGKEAFGGWDRLDLQALLTTRYSWDRAWRFPQLARGRSAAIRSREVARYVEALDRLIRTIASLAGADVVVDSSKLATHTQLLLQSSTLDVRLVHLVRDSRGVAYSNQKRVLKSVSSGEPTLLPRYGPVSSALRYDLYNGLHHMLARRRGLPFLRYRYEDVVTTPEAALRRLVAFAGGPEPDLGFLSDGCARLGPNHLVDGNPVRFHHGEVQLAPDLAWQTGLSPRRARTVAALTLPLLRGYGYPVSRPTPGVGAHHVGSG